MFNIPYQGYQQQPYQMPIQQNYQRPGSQTQENSLIRVTGIEGARAYQMPPNSTAALFDAGEDLMYIKSTDGAGFPTIRIFRFEPVSEAPGQASQGEFISREEFENYKKGVEDYVKQLISESDKQRTKSRSAAAD